MAQIPRKACKRCGGNVYETDMWVVEWGGTDVRKTTGVINPDICADCLFVGESVMDFVDYPNHDDVENGPDSPA